MRARTRTELCPLLHRALEVRDAAHHVDAHVERARQVGEAVRRAEEPVLREGHQLQVEVGGDDAAHLEQRLRPAERGVGCIDVAADRDEAHRHRPVAIGERPVAHLLDGSGPAQLTPERDAFEQRARGVDPRQPVGERRVHVEVRIDEGRRDKITAGINSSSDSFLRARRPG